ncbi:hypothetical protein JCGZ_24257 [Jatropha curcas]|uniref:Aminotransferase-like plant mobile domain-containing protein n=1 Tax=Jatropha curcas TaxID=180498 RepID=A0A067JYT6_JATCU|nr:hypothetical protein JCGZ_24257 [Jatropha curcas]
MSQPSEILASAYTPEMETLEVLPDIPTFDGEPMPVSQNPLTLGTRPLQLLPSLGTEFPVRYETSRMRGFQSEFMPASTVASRRLIWARPARVDQRLMLPPSGICWTRLCELGSSLQALGITLQDYAAGLRRTQPRFLPAMRYALMERWNDCTHTFIFEFSEMTLTPVDYAVITGLCFTGPVPPLDARRIPRYLAHCHHTYASGEDPEYWRNFLNDRELSDLFLTPWDCEAWRTYPGREVAELHTRSRLLMRGYWADRYFLRERVFDTPVAPAQRKVPHAPPRHMCLLEGLTQEDLEVEYRGFSANDFLSVGDFPAYFASRMQARLPEILEYT